MISNTEHALVADPISILGEMKPHEEQHRGKSETTPFRDGCSSSSDSALRGVCFEKVKREFNQITAACCEDGHAEACEQTLPEGAMGAISNPVQDLVQKRRRGCLDDGGLAEDLGFLSMCRANGSPGKTPIVIVSSGSFCPPHRGHFNMLTAAAEALHADTNANVEVVGFFLIPSAEEHIHRKHSEGRLKGHATAIVSYDLRVKVLHAMANDLNLPAKLHVSASEQSRANWYMSNFKDLVEKTVDVRLPSLVFVTGPDRKKAFKFCFPGCAGIVVVHREGDEMVAREDLAPQHLENPLFVEVSSPPCIFNMSSTKLREACLQALGSEACDSVREAALPFMSASSAELYAQAVMEGKSGIWDSKHPNCRMVP